MNLTDDERDLMTRVVLGEASKNPDERAAVAWNVLNRVGKPGYGGSVHDVILQRGQYNSVDNPKGPFYRHSASAYADARNIVDSVASGETPDPTGGATHFLAASMPKPKRPDWASGDGQKIGKTVFYGGNPPMSSDEADQYLANRRANQPAQPSIMSTDEADDYLEQRRAQQQPTAVAGQTPTPEAPSAPQQEQYPAGVGLQTLFHDLPEPLQNVIRNHPILSGAVAGAAVPAAVALGPEIGGALAGSAALRFIAPRIVGPLISGGSSVLGMEGLGRLLTGHSMLEELIRMGAKLGDEATP